MNKKELLENTKNILLGFETFLKFDVKKIEVKFICEELKKIIKDIEKLKWWEDDANE